jgi:predicted TIM-barrel fold metal-dependent hydrolase
MMTLREFIENEPMFDTHDHQAGFNQNWADKTYEEFIENEYTIADMNTAGADYKQGNGSHNLSIWKFARTTGYGQAANLATKSLLKNSFSEENAEKITEAIRDFVKDKTGAEIYEELYKIAKVKWVINDSVGGNITDLEFFSQKNCPNFFRSALRYGRDQALTITSKEQIQNLEKRFSFSLMSLSDLDELFDQHTQKAYETGNLAAVKISVAYVRKLDFEEVTFHEADRIFSAIRRGREINAKPLHDYLIHKIIQRAECINIPIQIHTGHQAGNWQDVRFTDPAHLVPIFQKYRNAKFDIFHAGWPFSEILGSIGKEFPNVWLDMCWAWALNPVQMERILDEWLATVPCNKIFAFGADAFSPFMMLGYAIQARNGIANVMEKKVQRKEFDAKTAEFVARRIMHQNAVEFFSW